MNQKKTIPKKTLLRINAVICLGLALFFFAFAVYNGQINHCKLISAAEKGVDVTDIESCKVFNLYQPGLNIPSTQGGLMFLPGSIAQGAGLILTIVMVIMYATIRYRINNRNTRAQSHSH